MECPDCGNNYEKLSSHISHNSVSCELPELNTTQKEILTGLLMGDGCVNYHSKYNPYIEANMITKEYLEYLKEQFPILSHKPKLRTTASEQAELSIKSGINPNANKCNYNDVFHWQTRRLDSIEQFVNWYSSGNKVWPNDIELTPTVLKHWYVCDGTLNQRSIRIAVSNELSNTNKIDNMFDSVGLPKPNRYDNTSACWNVRETDEIIEYMGKPLPGFKYKWCR